MRPLNVAILILVSLSSCLAAAGPSNIHQLCKINHSACLQELEIEYQKIKPQTFTWYQYKLYEIEAYFQLKQIEERLRLIKPLLILDEAPVNFKISVYIDYAKSMYLEKNYDESRNYAKKAKQLIELSVEAFDSPIKLVQLTNLTSYLISVDYELGVIDDKLAEYKKSYEFLNAVKHRYKRNTEPLFLAEINSNLGHLKNHMNDYKGALEHYVSAIPWFKIIGNRQQLGVGFFNVAKATKNLKEYKRSLHYYRRAHAEFAASNDISTKVYTELNIVEVFNKLGENENAKKLFSEIDPNLLMGYDLAFYNKIKQEMDKL